MNRIRARSKEDKDYKKSIIVDTARQLYLHNSTSLPSVSLIAKECRIAKGSIYNYFEAKEEIFLDILIIEYRKWFYDISSNLFKQDNIHLSLFKSFLKNQLLLELASLYQSSLEQNIRTEKLVEFKVFLGSHFEILSEKIVKDSTFTKNQITLKLMQSFSTIIGSYRTNQSTNRLESVENLKQYNFLFHDFEESVTGILHLIWK